MIDKLLTSKTNIKNTIDKIHRLTTILAAKPSILAAKPSIKHVKEIITAVYSEDYVPVSKNKLYTELTGNGSRFGIDTAITLLELKGFIYIDEETGLVHPTI